MSDQSNVCFIRARQRGGDYVFDGIRASGYQVVIPYKDFNLLFRCMREAWFRLHLPCREIWFNPEIKQITADTIIIGDPLIKPELVKWVRKKHPEAQIVLSYSNRAERSIAPESVTEYVTELWTYDPDDSEKYRMKLVHPSYLDIYQITGCEEPAYDVLYLGRDKGRSEELLALQKRLEALGLKTYFHICADRAYMRWKKPYYKPYLPYENYLKLLSQSKAVLNVMPEGQISITQRELEAVFDGVKCITTNKGIRSFALYDPSRYFVLGEDTLESISVFLAAECKAITAEQMEPYRFSVEIERMVDNIGRK